MMDRLKLEEKDVADEVGVTWPISKCSGGVALLQLIEGEGKR